MSPAAPRTDLGQLRFNQITLVAGVALASLLGAPLLLGVLFLLMLSQHGPLDGLVWLRRALRVAARPADQDPRPHRFARTVGAAVLGMSLLAFALGLGGLGWALALVVALLALLNLTTGFCAGCFMYFQLRMLQHRLSR